jgi:hypothetical protein
MSAQRRAAIELTLACLAVAGCVVSWLNAATAVDVAPVTDGEPTTTSVTYYAPLLLLSLICAAVAGVLAVLAVSRLRRAKHSHTP